MPIAASNLTSGKNASATSVTTASITPTANALVIVAVHQQVGSPQNIPTVSGCSMTWVQITSVQSATNTGKRMTFFRGMSASPSTGSLTIDFAGQTNAIAYSVDQFTGTDTSGTNGSGAIVQSAENDQSGTTTGITVTLSAFSDPGNAAYGFVGWGGGTAITVGSGFTQLSTDTTYAFSAEWKNNTTAVAWSWSSGTNWSQAIAIEISVPKTAKRSAGTLSMMGVGS